MSVSVNLLHKIAKGIVRAGSDSPPIAVDLDHGTQQAALYVIFIGKMIPIRIRIQNFEIRKRLLQIFILQRLVVRADVLNDSAGGVVLVGCCVAKRIGLAEKITRLHVVGICFSRYLTAVQLNLPGQIGSLGICAVRINPIFIACREVPGLVMCRLLRHISEAVIFIFRY
ncbi:hypothetical protein D3C75_824130 [compost metagenome]